MHVKLKILGFPGVSPDEWRMELRDGRMAEIREHLSGLCGNALAESKMLLGFVNGRSIGRDWASVSLRDGDAVMLVAPVSGG